LNSVTKRPAGGRADAKARGVNSGRKPILTPHQQNATRKRLEAGETQRSVARSYKSDHDFESQDFVRPQTEETPERAKYSGGLGRLRKGWDRLPRRCFLLAITASISHHLVGLSRKRIKRGALGPAGDTSIGVCNFTDSARTAGTTGTGHVPSLKFDLRAYGSARSMWDTRPLARTTRPLTQIASAYLHVPVLGQLAPAQLPAGEALEPGPLEVVSLDTAMHSTQGTEK
jgi:hypothetical protein